MVNVSTPETGSIGPSPHKSVTFNNQSMKEKLEQQMKELEEKKSQAERAVKAAEEAAKKRAVAASA
jgi:nuclear polyadenylated RNA-binding protein NAB2